MIVRSGVWISVCFLSFWNVSRDCLRCHRPDPLVIMEQLCCRFLRFFKNVSHCLSKGLACRWLDRPALQERLAPRALLVEVSARVSTSLLDCGPTLNARDKSVPSMWHVAETTSEPLERPAELLTPHGWPAVRPSSTCVSLLIGVASLQFLSVRRAQLNQRTTHKKEMSCVFEGTMNHGEWLSSVVGVRSAPRSLKRKARPNYVERSHSGSRGSAPRKFVKD